MSIPCRNGYFSQGWLGSGEANGKPTYGAARVAGLMAICMATGSPPLFSGKFAHGRWQSCPSRAWHSLIAAALKSAARESASNIGTASISGYHDPCGKRDPAKFSNPVIHL